MAQAIVKKWGNSPSVRLPVAVMKAASLNVDDTVDIEVEDGRIIIVPVRQKEYSLDALLAGISTDNLHGKADFGPAEGKELL
ncbi:AbrB/MazE/SpoVT family DNA-binding domain-containing protein [Klebsiella variicola]|uniref:AbrB/MazE/SpoVT family DNA-binding domain-containing protein n=1 Tax=Klebsiella michiganensis TaxID=1134687 RepID=A0A6P1V5D6_9ENTR|nr:MULTISPECIES: AbrB/MazE/SpoVT family DNA-binding domain-containing protein [Klebsiella]HBY9717368.1 AbrB/MazE/SpoVT family DNA-binding domain-containing protein [Klebsiella aerogenes]HDZ0780503.1 AbrB/MazE/SpoVT family DNA-binding domain-containing protein [Klebsiella pneumoniae]MCC5458502.1 AbrB/MazE/SpoVT family DNA-binding domain-containing protein [Klebsiella variicola]QHS49784.1 AbrB/MazE/SpoVT family DNA-binding domain-containing protein [Klebsiella michiganensis]UVW55804.1 AbrB/MazE/